MTPTRLALLCACAVGFAFSANYTNHAPLVPSLVQEFHFSQALAGLLTTGIFFTHAAMQIPGGHLADRFGARRVLACALAIVCIGNFSIAFASSYPQLLLWKVFVGFGTGASFVSAARYLAQAMPASELAMAQGYYGGSVLLGSGFVIFAVPRVAQAWGWPVGFLSTAAVATGVLLLWLLAAPEPERRPHPAGSLLALLGHRQLWLLGLVQMASFGLVIVIASWITMLLRTRLGLTVPAAGAVGSLVLLLGILTRPLGGTLVGHIGVRPVLMMSMVLNAAGCFLLGMGGASLSRAIVAIVLLGTGCGLPYAALFNRAAALFPGRAGAAMGLVNMLGIVMILVGAPLIGRVADWTGSYTSSFLSLGIFSLIVCVAATAVQRGAQPHL